MGAGPGDRRGALRVMLNFSGSVGEVASICRAKIRESQSAYMLATIVQELQFRTAVSVREEPFHEEGIVWTSELGLVERIGHLDLRLREEPPGFGDPRGVARMP